MRFVLQPWQLLLSIVAGWINDEQQKIIEYERTVIQVLLEKLGKKRIVLNDDQRRRLAVKGKVLGRKVLAQVGAALHAGHHSAAAAPATRGPEMGPQRPARRKVEPTTSSPGSRRLDAAIRQRKPHLGLRPDR